MSLIPCNGIQLAVAVKSLATLAVGILNLLSTNTD